MSSFQLNLNPLKKPLGFIKVLEWIASIFAFATCGGFKGKTEIQVACHPKVSDNKTITATLVIRNRNPTVSANYINQKQVAKRG
uniref:Uncharacterized protein n=1 Tax=Phocoena sinus TaxID=42100 RepID=A0A8C9CF87_PHOSS